MNPSAYFFGEKNKDHILRLCDQYLQERFSVHAPQHRLKSVLEASMQSIYQYYQDKPPFPSMDELNKKAIVRTKEQILLLVREAQATTQASAQATAQSSPQPTGQPSGPSSSQLSAQPPKQNDDKLENGETEKDFMKRLQELELQRNASVVNVSTPAPDPIVPPKARADTVAPPNLPTVLYVPTVSPPKTTRTILIHSIDRMWDYFHDRFHFGWSGPFPEMDSGESLQFSSILLPAKVAKETPVVEVHIEGVGGHHQRIFCTCVGAGEELGWHVWRPTSSTVATLKPIACPWTIKLYDVIGDALELGKDGFQVSDADLMMQTKNTRVTLSSSASDWKGNTLMWRNNGKIYRAKILNAYDATIEIRGDHLEHLKTGDICGLWNMQSTVVLEIVGN